ncbi:MAG: hypothetical protein OXE95_04945 [Chloroflexi bacterium]|nr:hypothetical protein [Chloroflexota bacterium]MCY4246909.1 hypothetical protein [Chloroflexota bacterium]
MNRKGIIIVLALLSLLAGGVFAHDSESPSLRHMTLRWGQHGVMFDLSSDIVLEATGLAAPQLRESLRNGETLAELITANGGDPAQTSAELTTLLSERIQTEATSRIAGLANSITRALERRQANKWHWRWLRPAPRLPFGEAMTGIVLEATGMDAQELRSALMDGSSIAQLIEANEGDVAQVVSALATQATAEVNAAASARLEMVEDVVSKAMGQDFSGVFERMSQLRRGLRGFFGAWDGIGMHTADETAQSAAA